MKTHRPEKPACCVRPLDNYPSRILARYFWTVCASGARPKRHKCRRKNNKRASQWKQSSRRWKTAWGMRRHLRGFWCCCSFSRKESTEMKTKTRKWKRYQNIILIASKHFRRFMIFLLTERWSSFICGRALSEHSEEMIYLCEISALLMISNWLFDERVWWCDDNDKHFFRLFSGLIQIRMNCAVLERFGWPTSSGLNINKKDC